MRKVAQVLVLIGALNWGLIGIGMLIKSSPSWNVVHMFLGKVPMIEGIVYLLVGLAAIKMFFCNCKGCRVAKPMNEAPKTM